MLAAPPEPVSETLTGRDDGSYVCAPSRGDDGGAAEAPAGCTELAGQSPRGRADVDVAAVAWAPPAKRPRTRRNAVAADPSKPAPRDDDGEGAARRPPGDTALRDGGGTRATALGELIGTDTTKKQAAGDDKPMADAIRDGDAHYTSASDVTTKHNNLVDGVEAMENIIGNGGGEPSESAAAGASEPSKEAVPSFFPGNAFVSDELRATLAGLDASDLKCVHKKAMLGSDRCGNQNRLLISCKKMVHGHGEQSLFAGILTEKERPLVHRPEPEEAAAQQVDEKHGGGEDKGRNKKIAKGKSKNRKKGKGKNRKKKGGGDEDMSGEDDQQEEKKKEKNTDKGLSVRACDRDGRAYNVQLKYLESNHGYRIIGPKWKVFLKDNGLLVGGGGATTGKRRKRSPGEDEEAGEERRRGGSPDGGDADDEAVVAVPAPPPSRSRKHRKPPSPDEASGEGTSGGSPPDEEEPNGGEHHHQEPQDAGDVHIEVWAFRSPKVALNENGLLLPDHPHGALGLLFLHRRDGEVCNVVGGAGAEEEVQHGAAPDGVTDEQPRQQDGHAGAAATEDEDDTGAHEVAGGDAPAVEPGGAAPRPAQDPRLTEVLEVMAAFCLIGMKDRYRDVDRNDKPKADP